MIVSSRKCDVEIYTCVCVFVDDDLVYAKQGSHILISPRPYQSIILKPHPKSLQLSKPACANLTSYRCICLLPPCSSSVPHAHQHTAHAMSLRLFRYGGVWFSKRNYPNKTMLINHMDPSTSTSYSSNRWIQQDPEIINLSGMNRDVNSDPPGWPISLWWFEDFESFWSVLPSGQQT